jgi:hypothetical protein
MKNSDLSANRFTVAAHSFSRKGGKSALLMKGILSKINLNFVKDVPTKYVNFTATESIFSEKKEEVLL